LKPGLDDIVARKRRDLEGRKSAVPFAVLERRLVLAAHVDYGGKPGAFFNLGDLRPNDALEVEMADGSVMRYRVVGNTQYDKKELPAEEVFRKTGETVLQLITCGGEFDPAARSYLANVVVTAVPEDSQSF
jgi:hypothetical protein